MPIDQCQVADGVNRPIAVGHGFLIFRLYDYALSGPWSDFRDCHVWPDLVLIYEQPDSGTLRLVCIGSHAELGL